MNSSRLARKEEKKMLKQTLLFGGLAIVLFLLFLFFLMPQVVRLASNVLDGPLGEPEDTIPPQVPIVAAPVSATYSAQLALKGVGEPKAEVVVVVNSGELERVTIDDNGEFEVEVPLTEGENAITLHSVDAAGNESTRSQTYSVNLDTQAPTIAVEQPQNGQTIELRRNQVTEVIGTTEANAQVSINDRLVYANSAGRFSLRYQLQEGENTLTIKATDQAGNQAETKLMVTFRL